MTDYPTLGELLKDARRAAGLTQEALAARAGLSARAISDLERNVSHAPRAGTVQLLIGALSLSAQEREHFEAAAQARQLTSSTIHHQSTAAAPDEPWPAADRRAISDVAVRAPLIGRAAELRLVEQHLDGEGPPLLVVEGEPGIGKTRLLEEAAAVAAARGLNVLHGTVPAAGEQVLRDPMVNALRRAVEKRSPVLLRRDLQGCAWLVRVLPELASGPIEPVPSMTLLAEQESALVIRAIVRFLTNTAGPAGSLLTLDNLHHADATALGSLAKLVEAAGNARVRLIGAYREGERGRGDSLSTLLAGLAHEQLVRHLRLGVLGINDSTDLLLRLVPGQGVTPATLDHVMRDTGGVPFYLVAWARDLLRLGAEPAEDHVPWPIQQSVRSRAHGQREVWAVLEAITVAGGRASFPLLVALTAQPDDAVLAALESASRERLVEEAGQTYGYAYGVVRRVVEADLSHARRVLLRQHLAEVLPRELQRIRGNQRAVGERDRGAGELAEPRAGRDRPGRAGGPRPSVSDERAYHLAVLRRHRGRPPASKRPPSEN